MDIRHGLNAFTLFMTFTSVVTGPTILLGDTAAPLPQTLQNPSFAQGSIGSAPDGWRVVTDPGSSAEAIAGIVVDDSRSGGRSVRLTAPIQGSDPSGPGVAIMSQRIDAMSYHGEEICFRMAVRMRGPPTTAGHASLWMRVDLPNGQHGFFDNMYDRPITSREWATYDIVGSVAPNAEKIVVGAMVFGPGSAECGSASLTVVSQQQAAEIVSHRKAAQVKPAVIDITLNAAVKPQKSGQSGTVTFPFPASTDNQAPLAYEVTAKPASALKGYMLQKREDCRNWICVAKVAPPMLGAIVTMNAIVLASSQSLPRRQVLAEQGSTQTAHQWIAATACVQSDDPTIHAKADELHTGVSSVGDYVSRVIDFTSNNQGVPGAAFTQLDAKAAMACGGSCTSRANLAAALIRAEGIPARTISAMPTYFGSTPYYEHWIAEFWQPNTGWVRIEPTLGNMQPNPATIVELSVANIADENRAFDKLHERYVMPGAPYLSSCELSPELVAADLFKTDAVNTSIVVSLLNASPAQLKTLAETAFVNFGRLQNLKGQGADSPHMRLQRIVAAARTGSASRLAQALEAKERSAKVEPLRTAFPD